MTVTVGRTVYELRGVSCIPLELVEPTRKGIAVTRSFGNPVTTWLEMREALASYAICAAEKMRRYKVAADNLFVFMHTNTFNNDPFYSNGTSAQFPASRTTLGSGRARGTPGRASLPRRIPLRTVRRDDYGAAARNGPAAGVVERAGPRTKTACLEDGRPAQRHAGAGNRPHPEHRAEGRGLETPGRVPVTAVDYAVG